MKPSWEWTEEDIQSLIDNQVKESLSLDFKGSDSLIPNSDSKKNEVSKDVSAFANSAGGVVVYGIVEDENLPVRVDTGYDPSVISREWLEQVINSRIQRRIDGIRINQVNLDATQPGRVLYVVDIPQSNRAPHMAADKKFYKRFNFASVPMEEYEVRDVARRAETPDLRVSLQIVSGPHVRLEAGDENFWAPIKIEGEIWNDTPAPAEYAQVKVFIDPTLKVVSAPGWLLSGEIAARTTGYDISLLVYTRNWSVYAGDLPLWEGPRFSLSTGPMELALSQSRTIPLLGWEIQSPRMEVRRSWYTFKRGFPSHYTELLDWTEEVHVS